MLRVLGMLSHAVDPTISNTLVPFAYIFSSPTKARDYCMKFDSRMAGTEPFEYGIWEEADKGQGKR